MELGLICTDANGSWTTHILSFIHSPPGLGRMQEWLLYWSVYDGSKLQALLDKNSKKANLINLLLCKSCLWSFSVWNKSGWTWEKLSEFTLNPAHSLCTICEWTRRVHRKWTFCSSHSLLRCPAVADWLELWSAGKVHLALRFWGGGAQWQDVGSL